MWSRTKNGKTLTCKLWNHPVAAPNEWQHVAAHGGIRRGDLDVQAVVALRSRSVPALPRPMILAVS